MNYYSILNKDSCLETNNDVFIVITDTKWDVMRKNKESQLQQLMCIFLTCNSFPLKMTTQRAETPWP